MSTHFSANQYDSAFSPQRLQSYEVPKRHKQHPSLRSGKTQTLTNNRGHLNPNVHRSPASPWGSFVGTWQAERRPIQLTTRTKLLAHLSKLDQGAGGEGGGDTSSSKKSNRAASAGVGRQSQQATSPVRPSSALESRQSVNNTQEVVPDSKPPTPGETEIKSSSTQPASETNTKPPTAASAELKSPTPAPENISAPATLAGSPRPPTDGISKLSPTPVPGTPVDAKYSARAMSAASSTRTSSTTSQSRMSPSRTSPSRAQSATTYSRGTPTRDPLLATPPSRVTTAATVFSQGGETTQSPIPSTRIPSPQTPAQL